MARKKKTKAQAQKRPVIKFIIIGFLVIGIGFAAGKGVMYLFRNVSYFKVQSVVIDPSLQFINKRDLRNLMGKNIFEVDLTATQRRLEHKYPQASRLKVMKRFPGQIAVIAKQRLPFMQIQTDGKVVTLDNEGVVLFTAGKGNGDLPIIVGTKLYNQRLVRGLPLNGVAIRTALEIAKFFQDDGNLSSYSMLEINMKNLSKITVTLSNDLKVIVDRDRIPKKIRVLGVVLSQGKLDLKHVKYIDLRFKEPIIGKK